MSETHRCMLVRCIGKYTIEYYPNYLYYTVKVIIRDHEVPLGHESIIYSYESK